MVTRIRKWGNSLAVRLPRPLAEAAALKPGSHVRLRAGPGGLTLTRVRAKGYRLAELVRGITGRNRPPPPH